MQAATTHAPSRVEGGDELLQLVEIEMYCCGVCEHHFKFESKLSVGATETETTLAELVIVMIVPIPPIPRAILRLQRAFGGLQLMRRDSQMMLRTSAGTRVGE